MPSIKRVVSVALGLLLISCTCVVAGAPMKADDGIQLSLDVASSLSSNGGDGKETALCSHAREVDVALPPGGGRDGSPSDTDVTHYQLNIEIIPEYNGLVVTTVKVEGVSTISAKSTIADLSTFTVNLSSNLTVNSVTGDVAGWTHVGDEVQITLDATYGVDEPFQVAVVYEGYPADGGFGAFTWWDRGGNLVVATLSEPYYARYWWPCKDVLGDKATMQMYCTVPAGMVVVSNGTEDPPVPISTDRILFRWHEDNPMAAYLASLAITNYERYDLTYTYDEGASTMPVPCYVYPDHWDFGLDEPKPAYKTGCDELPDMLEKLAVRYGPYPFLNEKYGVVETGGTGGLGASMEHQTISSMSRVDNFSDIMCHELAHQWWGDSVTCATWYDIWLNEGFASYSEPLYRELKAGGGVSSYWSRVNARRPSNPDARVYRTSIGSVGAIFSGNDVYNKGSWVLHMLRHVMGTEAFFDAIAQYRSDYADGFATTAQFTASISASFGHDLSWFTDEWVMNPGSPDHEWNWEAIEVGGQHYLKLLILQQQDGDGYGLCTMPVDIRVMTGSGATVHRVWNDAWQENYVLPIDGVPTDVRFDADEGVADRNWILADSLIQVATAVEGPPVIVAAQIEPLSGGTDETVAQLVFSEDIGDFDAGDVSLMGDGTGAHFPASVSYVGATHTATITFEGLPNDAFVLTVWDDAVLANGHMLDGEVDDSAWWDDTLLPSGDGQPGGDAVFEFAILAGDADCSGAVDVDDVGAYVAVLLGLDGDICHMRRADMDNNGAADGADIQAFVSVMVSG